LLLPEGNTGPGHWKQTEMGRGADREPVTIIRNFLRAVCVLALFYEIFSALKTPDPLS